MLSRCEHGNYVPKGDVKSPCCTGCNPPSPHIHVFRPSRNATKFIHERELDAVDYTERPISDRLSDAAQMENITA